MPEYRNIYSLSEEDRIREIGETLMQQPNKRAGVAIPYDGSGELGTRYIALLAERYPKITVVDRMVGPIDGLESIFVSYFVPQESKGAPSNQPKTKS